MSNLSQHPHLCGCFTWKKKQITNNFIFIQHHEIFHVSRAHKYYIYYCTIYTENIFRDARFPRQTNKKNTHTPYRWYTILLYIHTHIVQYIRWKNLILFTMVFGLSSFKAHTSRPGASSIKKKTHPGDGCFDRKYEFISLCTLLPFFWCQVNFVDWSVRYMHKERGDKSSL